MMVFVVLLSSIWMAVDADRLGYDKRDIQGLAAVGPAGWFFAGLLLWIVAFPLYLIKRPELKAAGERRRLGLGRAQAMGYLPPPPPPGYAPPYGPPPPPYGAYGPPPYPPPPHYGHPPMPGYPGGPPPPPPPQAPARLSADEVGDQIYKLGELRDAGILTEAEFQQQKAQILARM